MGNHIEKPECTDDYHVFGMGEKSKTVLIESGPSKGELHALCECTMAGYAIKMPDPVTLSKAMFEELVERAGYQKIPPAGFSKMIDS